MFIQIYEEKYMRFPEGKAKAITFSYDDGVRADKKLMAVLDKYGLKCTFNLNSLLFDCQCWHYRMDEKEAFEAYSGSGHEIALHGARHIFMDKVPLPEAINEVVQNRVYLENKFNRIVRGMAYAYNGYNDRIVEVLKSLGISYARTTDSSYSFEIPTDWLRLKPTCHHGDGKLQELSDRFFNTSPFEQKKHREPYLFYIWGHSYEFDNKNNWDVLENLGKRVSAATDIWCATNGEIYDYIQAYNNLVFSVDGERVYNPSHSAVWIELRGKVYRIDGGKELTFDRRTVIN